MAQKLDIKLSDDGCYTTYEIRKLYSGDLKEALLAFQRDGLIPLSLADVLQIRLNVFGTEFNVSKAEKHNWTDNSIVTATAMAYWRGEAKVLAPYARPLVRIKPDAQLGGLQMQLSGSEYGAIRPQPWRVMPRETLLQERMRQPLTQDRVIHHYAWRRAVGDQRLLADYAGQFIKHEDGMAVDLFWLGSQTPLLAPLVVGPTKYGSDLHDTRTGPSRYMIIGSVPEILDGVKGLLK